MARGGERGSRWSGRFIAIMALPIALYALYATGEKAVDSYRFSQQAEGLRVEIAALQHDNLRLQRDLELHRSDAYVEQMAREQLGLVKPGDQALVIVPPSDAGAVAPHVDPPSQARSPPQAGAGSGAPSEADAATPTWRHWWAYFVGSTARD